MGERFAGIAGSGPLLLAVAVATAAGLVSFLSPCVLPLVPGYLSYVTGIAGADVSERSPSRPGHGRTLAGATLFIAGFTLVFILAAVLVSNVGRLLFVHARTVEVVAGALTTVLGLSFLGLIPAAQYERRLRWLPSPGLAGAPMLGVVFGVGWIPCVSPTLSAVLALAAVEATTGRAVALAVAYCAGLGAPFIGLGLGLRRAIGAVAVARRHSRTITRIGGLMLVVVGVALMTGLWAAFTIWLRATVGPGQVGI
ncbi:cytochrome C biogenesis protein ResC [Actinoplanes sp. ATCC 53533]|uniref:cytochrome c biogenesis CcdA family protein n=1 Tax=Actinoplanes sp. ATCC 53533 TaxID=1288362 RepID=UPI000F79076A|nr:cytochrome c biogenesis protein CcdA [Actinoplanes sp. ATCC 53533]RSM71658.1 cytochrome C biogenesis protein ResC [Actinoplanes sp. ATCC 53533]